MYKCIECGNSVDRLYIKSETYVKLATCEMCTKTADKYFEYSDIIKLIDTILMKKKIYRHYICNVKNSMTIYKYFIINFICKLLYKHFITNNDSVCCMIIRTTVGYLFYHVILFLQLKNKISIGLLFRALTISSTYYLYLLFLIIWQVKSIHYGVILDILVLVSNAVAVSSVCDYSSRKVLQKIIVSMCLYFVFVIILL